MNDSTVSTMRPSTADTQVEQGVSSVRVAITPASVLRIAGNELRCLFVSPIAWALLIVMIVQTGIVYLNQTGNVIRWVFAGYEVPVTQTVFASSMQALYVQAYGNLMFYLPLLTMGLISRERQHGSIRLLMSSPVTIGQVVLGKYLAMLIYLLTFAAVMIGLVVLSGTLVPNFDYPFALSGLLGLYLLAATYAAVGLFMSSLTSHQVVAAISTIALLAALSFIGSVGQRVPLIDDVAYWLSIDGRADLMRNGLVASKDVIYFVLVSGLFLLFTFLKLSAGRLSESAWRRGLKYTAALTVVVALGYVSSLPQLTGYADLTRPDSRTLSVGSQRALTGLDGTVNITVLVNGLNPRASLFLPASRNSLYRRLFEQHERQIGRINMNYRFYYADSENNQLYEANPGKSNEQLAREFAEQNRLDFDDFLSQADADRLYRLEAESYRNVYRVEWQDRATVIRNFDDPRYFPAEPAISAALSGLVSEPLQVAYVYGHGERRIFRAGGEDHRGHVSDVRDRYALLNHGFEVREVAATDVIPDDVDILVLAAPTSELAAAFVERLESFVESGGDVLLLTEPGQESIVNPLLAEWGLRQLPGQVVQPKEEYPAELVYAGLTPDALKAGFEMPRRNLDGPVVLPGAAGFEFERDAKFDWRPLLPWADDMSIEGASGLVPDGLAFASERQQGGMTQRIVVIGDADFMSTATRGLRDPQNKNNPEFVNDVFRYLADGQYPIDTSRPAPLDTEINLDLRELDILRFALLGVVPGLLLLMGGWILISRRRH